MDTLNFILKRYNLDINTPPSPLRIPYSRWGEMSSLFRDLGFKKGVEVGVYRGKFSKALCTNNPTLELFGVDSWSVYGNYSEYEAQDLQEAYKAALAETKEYNVKFIKESSMDAVKQFDDESLDFVFIDANHDFEHVVADISTWSKKVRKGGLVCGHDYVKSSKFNFGVIDAVDGWCKAYNIKPLFLWKDQCPSWMYIK